MLLKHDCTLAGRQTDITLPIIILQCVSTHCDAWKSLKYRCCYIHIPSTLQGLPSYQLLRYW